MSTLLSATHVHLVGIKGVAMASLAQCLDDRNIHVTGCDVEEAFVTQELLVRRGFLVTVGFDAADLPEETDLVVYTGAHQGKKNPVVQEAIARHIPVLSHAAALGELMEGKVGISVAGTGGKTTTSAMLAWILEYSHKNPSFSIGVGNAKNLGCTGKLSPAYAQQRSVFVAEADEYAVDPTSDHRPRFTYQHPETIVCTNLSYDHPDIYPDFESMQRTFADFFSRNSVSVYVNADCEPLLQLFEQLRRDEKIDVQSCSVGFHIASDYLLTALSSEPGTNRFRIEYQGIFERQPHLYGQHVWECKLQIPGEHNVRNAGLAFVTAIHHDVDPMLAAEALAQFSGTMRRFEYKGRYGEMECYDDYAHTPDEISTTIKALRAWRPKKRILAAFQPHTYSRTTALFDGFVESLSLADEVVLLPIFASAREQADPTVSSAMLADRIGTKAQVLPTIEELTTWLPAKAHDDCVCITLGAGDIYTVYEQLEMTNS